MTNQIAPTARPDASRRAVPRTLGRRLQVVGPMTYMTLGEYRDPQRAWLPAVLY